jgi:hypothetical protein
MGLWLRVTPSDHAISTTLDRYMHLSVETPHLRPSTIAFGLHNERLDRRSRRLVK